MPTKERLSSLKDKKPKNYYEILAVDRDASEVQIKEKYKKLALEVHPDRNQGENKDEMDELFKLVGEAYETLKDPKKRKEHNFALDNPLALDSPIALDSSIADEHSLMAHFNDLADYRGDQALVMNDYLNGPDGKRELNEYGGLQFNSLAQRDSFMNRQHDNKREFSFSFDVDGTSKGYNKYDPQHMGFRDGSSYKGNLDKIYETMKMEKIKLQNELTDLKNNNPLALEDKTTQGALQVVNEGAIQVVSDREKQIAEKEQALRLQGYKMDKVRVSMGRDYNPQFNKSKSEVTPALTNGENMPLLKEAESKPMLEQADSMPMLEAPSATKDSSKAIVQVNSLMGSSSSLTSPASNPSSTSLTQIILPQIVPTFHS